MATERQGLQSDYLTEACPLIDQLGVDLLMIGEGPVDLPVLVAAIERLDGLKAMGERHGDPEVAQVAGGVSEVFSGILCDLIPDVAGSLQVASDALGRLKTHLDLDAPGSPSPALRSSYEAVCGILGKPVEAVAGDGAASEVGEAPSAFVAGMLPLLSEAVASIESCAGDTSDLPTLVAAMETLDVAKAMAQEHQEAASYKMCFGLVELLSSVLCEQADDPAAAMDCVRKGASAYRGFLTAECPAAGQSDLAGDIEALFTHLDVPIVEEPWNAADGIESILFEEPSGSSAPVEAAPPAVPQADVDEESASTGLPVEFDDVDLYREFAFEANEHLEAIEESILELENSPGDTALINEIFRPIHSVKGGAGFLCLMGLSKLAHDTETLLDRCRKNELAVTGEIVEVCLKSGDALKHMIGNIITAVEAPDPNAVRCDAVVYGHIREDIHRILDGEPQAAASTAPEAAAVPQPVPSSAPEAAPPPAVPALTGEDHASTGVPESLGDEEDIDLLKRFVLQCNEHTESIEEQILSLERDPDDAELINGIFRAFHSIKGDSGFLDLKGISGLAHDTETILGRLREKKISVSPRVIELCLGSVDFLKQMFSNLSRVLESRDPAAEAQAVEEVVFGPLRQSIQSFLEDPSSPPRIGEILVESGDITQAELEEALDLQNAPIGEVLAKTAAVPEAKVTQALEQQRRSGGGGGTGGAKAIKVDTGKIDSLVNLVGELVIIEAQVAQAALSANGANGDAEDQATAKNLSQLGKITKELQDRSMSLRMMPIRQTFQKMMRLVRDASKKMDKKVSLVLSGEDTELDKNVVEQIGDPLVHMLRNSVDHGVEMPEERKAAGKPETGTVHLDAYYQGDRINIRVTDDGKGLNRERLIAKAIQNGLISDGDSLSDSEAFNLIFAPGFSTAETVTDISGRGVGMDVVRRNIDKLRGKIEVESEEGVGTTITISLPLTLAIIDGMVVGVGEEEYIIPTVTIQESLQPRREDISTVTERGEMINVRGKLMPLIRLHEMWNIDAKYTDPCEALVVIVEANGRNACLMVDKLVGQQQIVIKNLGDHFRDVRGLTGATILGSGRVGLILDSDGIMKRAIGS